MPLTEQLPQVDSLCAEGFLAGFGIDDDAEHGLGVTGYGITISAPQKM